MAEKQIQLISNQIKKLESEDFDLEAWKASTVAIIKKCFGKKDAKIQQIENLKIDYSSWALRDSNASYKPIESCKKIGKAVLESAIEELELTDSEEEHEIPLSKYFSSKQTKQLLDKNTSVQEKLKMIKKLKKAELESLILSLFQNK